MATIRKRAKHAAARAIDAAITAAVAVRGGARAAAIPPSPRVLVIRCDHIGDAVMATSVLRPLRDALNPAALDVLAGPWAAAVFQRHPSVDDVLIHATPWWSAARGAPMRERLAHWSSLPRLVREIRARRYDIGIDLRGDLRQIALFLGLGGMPVRVSSDRTGGRSLLTHVWAHDASLHEVEKDFAIAALLGATGTPRLDLATEAVSAHRAIELPRGGYAVLALRGSEPNREWPAESASTVVDALQREMGLASVCIGTAADAGVADAVARGAQFPVVNLAGQTSLPDAIDVVRDAAVVIAVDSGPMHIAAAVGTPVVALFGPGDPRECGPWTTRAEVVATTAPCGCSGARCDFVAGSGRCMRAITPAMVVEAVHRAVSRVKPVG